MKFFPNGPGWRYLWGILSAWPLAFAGQAAEGIVDSLTSLIKSDEQALVSLPYQTPDPDFKFSFTATNTLDPYFLRSVLFFSDPAYLALAGQSECHFYAAIENDLLKTALGPLRKVVIQNENRQTIALSKNEFIAAANEKCATNQENARLFSLENLATTLSRLSFTVPADPVACQQIWQDWWKNPYTPYLCRIAQTERLAYEANEKLKKIDARLAQAAQGSQPEQVAEYGFWQQIKNRQQTYQHLLSYEQRTYLNHLCPHIDDAQAYCQNYFSHDVWSQVLQGQLPFSYMAYLCQDLYHLNFGSPHDLEPCKDPLAARPENCLKLFPGKTFYPAPDCQQLQILAYGRLQTNYHDCAAKFDYPEIANWFRIAQHFASFDQQKNKDKNKKSLDGQGKDKNKNALSTSTAGLTAPLTLPQCFFQIAQPVYLALAAKDRLDLWPLHLCYQDVYNVKEVCTPYVPGQGDAPYAQERLITTALRRSSDRMEVDCHFIEEKSYRPSTLAYGPGCFITYQADRCFAFDCPTDIKVHKESTYQVSYQGQLNFDYFPTSYATAGNSLFKIMGQYLKREQKLIRNLTELFYFLNTNSRGIIHGLACLEDMLPEFFAKTSLGQCTAHPFIIDGHAKQESDTVLSVHLPLDDVHLPRQIRWQNIYQGVQNFQQTHPLKTWAMYGIW